MTSGDLIDNNSPFGYLVIGENYEPYLDESVKDLQFEPDDKRTWGQGGKRDFIRDYCRHGSTHSIVTGGSGYYKSSCLITNLCTWTGSAVVLDPSEEIAPVVMRQRWAMDHDVHVLSQGGSSGFNALDWIDPDSPSFEDDVINIIELISGYTSRHDQTAQFFKDSGKTMLACFLANMLAAPELPPEEKNLRNFRAYISVSDEEIKSRLKSVAAVSRSSFARDIAADLMDTPAETFGGLRRNAMQDTTWLSIPAHANLVSGNSFRTRDILNGHTDIFLSLPLNVLQDTPGVGRTIIGALLNAAYRAKGRIRGRPGVNGRPRRGRIYYAIDEAWVLRNMGIVSTAFAAGRKSGITMQLYYPAYSLMEQQWGTHGADAIEAVTSWRSFAAIKDQKTAAKISKDLGERGVIVETDSINSGWSGRSAGFGRANKSSGRSKSFSEIRRPLLYPEEIQWDMRDDEAIVLGVHGRPIRCGRAIYWRRPELLALLDANPFIEALDEEAAD